MTQEPAPLIFAHAVSANENPRAAAEHVAEQIVLRVGPSPDLLMLFIGGGFAPAAEAIAQAVRLIVKPRHLVGVTASGVIGGETELERRPALTALAARLPGVEVVPLSHEDLISISDAGLDAGAALRGRSTLPLSGTMLFADPFSVPLTSLTAGLSAAHADGTDPAPVLFGGLASGSESPGGNTLILDDTGTHEGAIGLALFGDLRCDVTVSQGCRPVGESRVVTRSKGNLVLELGGRPALEVIKEIVQGLDEDDRRLLAGGLFLGRAVNEYKTRLGRGDYLIRNVVGADERSSAVAVADLIPPGRSVRLHLRDATTATEDLELLLDAQRLYDRPPGMLLITCTGRGERFFGKQNHDAVTIQKAFLPQESGVESAKAGRRIEPNDQLVPMAGFFAAGEIGPIGDESRVHGFTSCLVCFRRRER